MHLANNPQKTALYSLIALLLPLMLGACSESANTSAASHAGHTGHKQTSHGSHKHEAGHGGHGHAGNTFVHFTSEEIDEFGLELRTANSGTVAKTSKLPGEITLNPNRVAQVTPRVPGVVRDVYVTIGDQIKKGEVMAVLTSRKLAQAKSAYLSAQSKLDLARANYQRAKNLWQQEITAKSEYLASRQSFEKARVDARLAEQELQALGLSQTQITGLAKQDMNNLARYELTAPISGEVVHRSITQGEVLPNHPEKPAFVVADLSKVWVNLTVYPKDLAAIHTGQEVVIESQKGRLKTTDTITYVSPIVGEGTRTATARVVLDNAKGRWKPGLFVTARVRTDEKSVEVAVPKSALHTINKKTVVFVQTPKGFKAAPVKTGLSNGQSVQILSGLKAGQTYVADNGFAIKAELLKGTFSGHSH